MSPSFLKYHNKSIALEIKTKLLTMVWQIELECTFFANLALDTKRYHRWLVCSHPEQEQNECLFLKVGGRDRRWVKLDFAGHKFLLSIPSWQTTSILSGLTQSFYFAHNFLGQECGNGDWVVCLWYMWHHHCTWDKDQATYHAVAD